MTTPERDAYLSLDIEADGPIPGRFSMLSFGLCWAGSFDGDKYEPGDPEAHTFYRELRPISDAFDPQALSVSGLDRERLVREGTPPGDALREADAWIRGVAGSARPVVCAFPASFDWTFFWWYMVEFGPVEPALQFSSCIDTKTLVMAKTGRTLARSSLDALPAALRSPRPHKHHGLSDAIEQADVFARAFVWRKSGDEAG